MNEQHHVTHPNKNLAKEVKIVAWEDINMQMDLTLRKVW